MGWKCKACQKDINSSDPYMPCTECKDWYCEECADMTFCSFISLGNLCNKCNNVGRVKKPRRQELLEYVCKKYKTSLKEIESEWKAEQVIRWCPCYICKETECIVAHLNEGGKCCKCVGEKLCSNCKLK
jgi:hypothetical protein